MKKRGFTIIELMLVIAIIAVLMTIVVSAAKGAIVASRQRRAESLASIIRTGISAYRSQMDKWPEPLGGRVAANNFSGCHQRRKGWMGEVIPNLKVLPMEESHQVIRELVRQAHDGNPVVDISGLYVSRSKGRKSDRDHGMDFLDAIRGTKQSRKKMKMNEMNFGFPDADGYFRYFAITYDTATDDIGVDIWDYNIFNMQE